MEHIIGHLELWIGPMYSGKTTHLIQAYKKYKYIGKNIIVINFDQDKRYHETMLSTHDKIMIPCIQSHNLTNVMEEMINSDVILINEGQFFDDLFETVIDLVENKHKIVCISALDGDFKRQRFGRVLDLIPYCDDLTRLHALCFHCRNGKRASFSYRVTSETTQVSIGSNNYVPLCRKCYQMYDNDNANKSLEHTESA
jgi:thymidine kinase